jgi:hypothetical protein
VFHEEQFEKLRRGEISQAGLFVCGLFSWSSICVISGCLCIGFWRESGYIALALYIRIAELSGGFGFIGLPKTNARPKAFCD